jgi:hypothetical protein
MSFEWPIRPLGRHLRRTTGRIWPLSVRLVGRLPRSTLAAVALKSRRLDSYAGRHPYASGTLSLPALNLVHATEPDLGPVRASEWSIERLSPHGERARNSQHRSARALRREDSVITRPPQGIVERNVDQSGEKGVAYFTRCAGKPGDGMVGGRTRGELAVADG